MQMRCGHAARMSTAGNDLASPHPVAFFDQQGLRVGVHRRQAAPVRQDDGPAITAQLVGGIDHLAVAGRADRRAIGHRQIDTLVRPTPATAESRRQRRMQRPRQPTRRRWPDLAQHRHRRHRCHDGRGRTPREAKGPYHASHHACGGSPPQPYRPTRSTNMHGVLHSVS